MYHGESSRQVKGLPGLAALSGVEMKLDNLAGGACESQSRFPKGPSKAAVSSGRLVQRPMVTISCIEMLLFAAHLVNGS
jgi:hypothetical protein